MATSRYAPIFDNRTLVKEPLAQYLKRVGALLPKFPFPVLTQWFYDHPQTVAQYDWLNFPSLNFTLETWKTDAIPTSSFGNVSCVMLYKENYFTGRAKSERTDRLGSYFIDHGTWPVPPIILENFNAEFTFPHGFKCGTPYHLLEGHNRLAQFIGFKERNVLRQTHQLYVTRYEQRNGR